MRLFIPALTGLSLSVTLTAAGEILQRDAARDSTLFEPDPGALTVDANGGDENLYIGLTAREPERRRRALLGFDLGAIPTGARITAVELTIPAEPRRQKPAAAASLHRLQRDWSEGETAGGDGRGAPAEAGDSTWLHAVFDREFWQTPGGDFVAEASASVSAAAAQPLVFASTAALVADVQGWIDDPASNFGWLLRGDEDDTGSARRLRSRENPGGAPSLRVEFAPPQTDALFESGFEDGS